VEVIKASDFGFEQEPKCDSCGKRVPKIVSFDNRAFVTWLCEECLAKALKLIRGEE